MIVERFADPAAMARAAAALVVDRANAAIAARGRFLFVLAGGSTPRSVYELLAAAPIEWSRVHVFWGDERCVPPASPRSNFRMAREALLDRVTVPEANIHRMRGEDDPAAAAAGYEQVLRRHAMPSFDLVLLGMGADGHTASIFPGSDAMRERTRWVVATPGPDGWRVTLTPVVLNAAAEAMFLVTGAEKAARLKQVLDGSAPEPLPAQLVQSGVVRWMVDAAAAG